MKNYYLILLEDTGRSFNINMHCFECFALSKEEAIGKMVLSKPEFKTRKIQKITEINGLTNESSVCFLDPDYEKDIENALLALNLK